VRFSGVSCGYDRAAVLRGIDLTIDEGAFVGIVGPSGAGKTTLLRAIVGAVPRIEGSLTFDGRPVGRGGTPGVGWVPQRPAHYGRLSARENLELFARLEGVLVRECEKGGTAATIKTAMDRAINQIQAETSGQRDRAKEAVSRAAEKLRGGFHTAPPPPKRDED
jgi:ABC-2 type transport system ATP-binding protein